MGAEFIVWLILGGMGIFVVLGMIGVLNFFVAHHLAFTFVFVGGMYLIWWLFAAADLKLKIIVTLAAIPGVLVGDWASLSWNEFWVIRGRKNRLVDRKLTPDQKAKYVDMEHYDYRGRLRHKYGGTGVDNDAD